MKGAIAGGLILAIALTGCQKKPATTDDGLGAGAAAPAPTDTVVSDTMRAPAVPADTSYRPQ